MRRGEKGAENDAPSALGRLSSREYEPTREAAIASFVKSWRK